VKTLVSAFESSKAGCAIAVEEVPIEHVSLYGIVEPTTNTEVFEITGLVEKPARGEARSNLAIAARYVFAPRIFEAIRNTPLDSRGELQLTDAIGLLLKKGERIIGVRLPREEKRYDIGNFESYFATFIEFALTDPSYERKLRALVKELLHENNQ